MSTKSLLGIIRKRRSVRVYKSGKATDKLLALILEATAKITSEM